MFKSRDIDMLHGPLLGKILAFTFPLIITYCMQQLFNTADSAVAGRFVSSEALAAIGSTASVVSLAIDTFAGLAIGANVVVAVRVARGDDAETRDAVHTAMLFALASGVALIVIGWLATGPLLVAIATPAEVMEPATQYLRFYFAGSPFIMVYNFGSAVLRSKGDTQGPLLALAFACGINIVLNLLFTLVFPWGIAGIAFGTFLAYGLAGGIVVAIMLRDSGPTRLDVRKLRIVREPLVELLKIGVPAGVQGGVFAISNLVIQSALNGFGSAAVAGAAAALSYEFYAYFFIMGFGQAAVSFIGQNRAAHKFDRCRRIFWICVACSLVTCGVICVIYALVPVPLFMLFTTDSEAIAFGCIRMWHVGVVSFIAVLFDVPAGCMRGMGSSLMPAIITVLGTCVFRVIWVCTVFAANPTFETLCDVYPLSWFITGAAMFAAYFYVRKTVEGV